MALARTLSPSERERAERFRVPEARRQFVFGGRGFRDLRMIPSTDHPLNQGSFKQGLCRLGGHDVAEVTSKLDAVGSTPVPALTPVA
jgi:hypothetical protein